MKVMKQEDMEIIRDLLMYLAGCMDTAGDTSYASSFSYVRGNLKSVYYKYLYSRNSCE